MKYQQNQFFEQINFQEIAPTIKNLLYEATVVDVGEFTHEP
jgi:hypothetical protein